MNRAYKVGVAGTHSTGKTTFLDEVEERLKASGLSIGRVADLASAARDHGFPILRDHTFESTVWIVCRGMTLEVEAARGNDVVLVDRPVQDAYGYLEAALEHRSEVLDANHRAYLDTIVRAHAATYDRVCLTRLDPTRGIDDTKPRDQDAAFRGMAEAGILKVLERISTRGLELPSEPGQRAAALDELVNEIVSIVRR